MRAMLVRWFMSNSTLDRALIVTGMLLLVRLVARFVKSEQLAVAPDVTVVPKQKLMIRETNNAEIKTTDNASNSTAVSRRTESAASSSSPIDIKFEAWLKQQGHDLDDDPDDSENQEDETTDHTHENREAESSGLVGAYVQTDIGFVKRCIQLV